MMSAGRVSLAPVYDLLTATVVPSRDGGLSFFYFYPHLA